MSSLQTSNAAPNTYYQPLNAVSGALSPNTPLANAYNSYGLTTEHQGHYSYNAYDYYMALQQSNAYLSQRVSNLESELHKEIELRTNIESRMLVLEEQMKELLMNKKRKK